MGRLDEKLDAILARLGKKNDREAEEDDKGN
jgi:hypothetical protein